MDLKLWGRDGIAQGGSELHRVFNNLRTWREYGHTHTHTHAHTHTHVHTHTHTHTHVHTHVHVHTHTHTTPHYQVLHVGHLQPPSISCGGDDPKKRDLPQVAQMLCGTKRK